MAEAASPGTAVRVVCPNEAVPSAAASVSRPTGPPLYISMMARSTLRSSSSRPKASTSMRLRPIRATSRSMTPSPSTVAKSRMRLRKRLATRGVPRLHLASS